MRILIISSYLPYPLINGGNIRLYNLIKQLSQKHKITLICEQREFQTELDIQEIKQYCEEVITVTRKKQWTWQNICKAGFSLHSFLEVGHELPEMKAKIVEVMLRKTFDVIHVETFYVFQNLPKTYVPIVLVEHNIEYLVYRRNAVNAKPYLRPLFYLDAWKVKYSEEQFWKKADRLVAVSEEDKNVMLKKRKDVSIVANGVDCDLYKPGEPKDKTKRILFIGDFKWLQNIQALEWIIKGIWPKIELRIKPSSRAQAEGNQELRILLWIVGRNIPASIKALGTDTILFGENEKDTLKVYQQSTILLAPIKVGGGSSYKIIESMASGVPVVTTELGAKGISAVHESEILVGETTDELAQLVIKLLQNKTVYERIRKRARKFIEQRYDWKLIAEELDKVYKSVQNYG